MKRSELYSFLQRAGVSLISLSCHTHILQTHISLSYRQGHVSYGYNVPPDSTILFNFISCSNFKDTELPTPLGPTYTLENTPLCPQLFFFRFRNFKLERTAKGNWMKSMPFRGKRKPLCFRLRYICCHFWCNFLRAPFPLLKIHFLFSFVSCFFCRNIAQLLGKALFQLY